MSDINKLNNKKEVEKINITNGEMNKTQYIDNSSIITDVSLDALVSKKESNNYMHNNGIAKNISNEKNIKDMVISDTKKPTGEPLEIKDDEQTAKIEKLATNTTESQESQENHEEQNSIDLKRYTAMSLEELATELEKLVKNENIKAIKKHVDFINTEFKSKLQKLIDEKKEVFLNEGGNEIDFHYSSPVQKRFKEAYNAYRKKRNEHQKNLEQNLKQNLSDKLEIIEELKGLVNLEENINNTYKRFKKLQERWRSTGPIPRDKYNNAWNSYHHQLEVFYDFLHLNRDLRDLDFKHNLEKKLLIIERAEELAKDHDAMRAFRELQELHKIWKEELGPVDREHREEIWNRFKIATKIINDKRQAYFKETDKIHEKNLEYRLELIANINTINEQQIDSHTGWQNAIKQLEELRSQFLNSGKVPIKANGDTWTKFKDSVRAFNSKKNAFYKELKTDQYKNLQLKLDLIKIAEDHKDSEDFETVTPLMKKIQTDWKKIGIVPRKDSDKIWKQFKEVCNYYFDRIHSKQQAANQEQIEAYNNKNELLSNLKTLKLLEDKDKGLEIIKEQIKKWQSLGQVPNDKRYIDNKFQKAIDGLLITLDIDRAQAEMITYENKLDSLVSPNDGKNLDNERIFIRKKIDEVKGQINQLENNLQFFKNVNEDNPLVKDVLSNIKKHREDLEIWNAKLQRLKKFISNAK